MINGSWGLGENVVKGAVTPDEYMVFKPFLDRDDLVPIVGKTLGSKEQKLVYAKGGETDEVFIVQARPETVQSQKQPTSLQTYALKDGLHRSDRQTARRCRRVG